MPTKSWLTYLIVVQLSLSCCIHAALAGEANKPSTEEHFFIGYVVDDTQSTPKEKRMIRTGIELRPNGSGNYEHDEIVYGSLAPLVEEAWHPQPANNKISPEEARNLVNHLIQSNFFGLKSDPDMTRHEHAPDDYREHFTYMNRAENIQIFFCTRPTSASRKALRDLMFDFASRTKLDEPPFRWTLTKHTEGDGVKPREVDLKYLLAHAPEYDGKRVSVRGYYRWEFEGSSMGPDKATVENRDYSNGIWIGAPSSFAHVISPESVQIGVWLRIDGVFQKGPAGHLGGWPGQIDRITRLDMVPPFL